MHALSATAAEVLRAILDEQPLNEAKVRFAWRMAAGPTLAGASSTVSWSDDGRLSVTVKSDDWRREVARARPLIMDRLAGLLGPGAVKTLHVEAPAAPDGSRLPRRPRPRRP